MTPPHSLRHRGFHLSRRLLAAGVAACALGLTAAQATIYNWDANGVDPVDGGSGTMSGSAGRWTTSAYGSSGATYTAYSGIASATTHDFVIGGTAGTITLGGNMGFGSLTIDTPNYILQSNGTNSRNFFVVTGYSGAGLSSLIVRPDTGGNRLISLGVGNGNSSTFSASLTDNGANRLSVTIGALSYLGELTLSGTNTYSGSTSLTAANASGLKVTIDSDARLGTPPASATPDFLVFSMSSSGAGATGTLRFTESTTLNANRGIGIGRTDANNGNAQFEVDDGKTVTYNGIIARLSGSTGTAGFRKAGSGTLILGGANSYNGTTTISNGTLVFANTQAKTVGTATVAAAATVGLGVGGAGYYSETDVDNLFDTTLTGFSLAAASGVAIDTTAGDFVQSTNLSAARPLTKLGPNTLTLSGTNTYSGATTVAGGTLAITGSITSAVTVNAGSALAGNGSSGALSGAGLVSPGGSPGILTTTQVDPAGGLNFAFELTALGAPDYSNAGASLNDVLRITGGTPFASSLTASNVVDVYFNLASLNGGNVLTGGFYTDLASEFLASLQDATVNYYVRGDGSGTTLFNGVNYYTLTEYDPTMSVVLATISEAAAFAGGGANGYVTQFTLAVVPEPVSALLLLGALLAVGRRRRAA